MNVKILEYLTSVTGTGQKDNWDVDGEEFFKHFPHDTATLNELRQLKRLGYISAMEAEDEEFYTIGVNDSAHQFINNRKN